MALKVTVGAEFETFIERLIESGRYSIAAEVVDDALYYFEERERADDAKLELLRAEIQKGIESGPGREVDAKTLAEEIKARGMRKLAAAKNGRA
eukprot:gene16115-biopygen13730